MISRSLPGSAGVLSLLALLLLSAPLVPAKDRDKNKEAAPPIRWAADRPGCGFTRGDDGKYRYDLKAGDLEITIAVDSREIQEVHRRPVSVLGVFGTFQYRGKDSLAIQPNTMTLEFLMHSKVVQNAYGQGALAARLQKDSDAISNQTEREVRKHPGKKQELDTQLQTYLKELTEMTEFVNTHTLTATALTPKEPTASGWIFFSTDNKWIGPLKKQEKFLLRISLGNQFFEFPFTLPPIEGDVILRHRAE